MEMRDLNINNEGTIGTTANSSVYSNSHISEAFSRMQGKVGVPSKGVAAY